MVLLVWWIAPNLAFWSLLPQHVLRYTLPLAPAIAVLGGIGMVGILRQAHSERFYRLSAVLILMGILLTRGIYTEVVLAGRTISRQARENATELRRLVPEGETVYIAGLREEGVLFYADRRVRRLTSTPVHDIYLLLTEAEVQSDRYEPNAFVGEFKDQQKASVRVVRWSGNLP